MGSPTTVALGELIHAQVRVAIETAVHEELAIALGAGRYERHGGRRGKELLALELCGSESGNAWTGFVDDLRACGLRAPPTSSSASPRNSGSA